jgi:hypothetical protein
MFGVEGGDVLFELGEKKVRVYPEDSTAGTA